jgi:hypothetical protein
MLRHENVSRRFFILKFSRGLVFRLELKRLVQKRFISFQLELLFRMANFLDKILDKYFPVGVLLGCVLLQSSSLLQDH